MKRIILALILGINFFYSLSFSSQPQEIHCKHFFKGYPLGTPAMNDMIIRDAYALSSNDSTKFADWVVYKLDSISISGGSRSRIWRADPWLDDNETLEPDDYKNSNEQEHYDRGHQAPLASLKGSPEWETTNYLSNITPQVSDLNQGPWKELEDRERDLVKEYGTVYVMTGPLYERQMPPMPEADEYHRVPSGYWKIIITPKGNSAFNVAGFIFDQKTRKDDNYMKHIVKISDIEKRSKLDFFWELEDTLESKIENKVDIKWLKSK